MDVVFRVGQLELEVVGVEWFAHCQKFIFVGTGAGLMFNQIFSVE